MSNKLRQKIKDAYQDLSNRKAGIKKLERLRAEMKNAFDERLKALYQKRNVLAEIERRREALRKWRISIFKTIFPINFKYVASAPFIYGISFPLVFFHLGLEIYHQVCFRIYGIPLVNADEYFIYDRHLLPYLNWLEKINCFYCSYANNLIRYAAEISGRTERFWCPIKYASRLERAHSQYPKFVDYLDAENFREKWEELRQFSDLKEEGEKEVENTKKNKARK